MTTDVKPHFSDLKCKYMEIFEKQSKILAIYGIQTPGGRRLNLRTCKVNRKKDRRNFWMEVKDPDLNLLNLYTNGQ